MLDSPMAIIDMGKTDKELYGVEHLSSIVLGNWPIFGDLFQKRNRTQVYLDEIAELRHNVSHRRNHHLLRRGDLLRFIRNAHLILNALDSELSIRFDAIATSIEQGSSPWGRELVGTLPPATEIVFEFVGRDSEIRTLSSWLTTETSRQLVIWGYGGSGKSTLAYQFARAVRDGAPANLQAVIWLSAKVREYVEGTTRDRTADFDSIQSFGSALWTALYDASPSSEQLSREEIVSELSVTPSLLVVDDLDSVLEDEDLTHFLLYELPLSKSRILYTTRQRIPGLQTIDVKGFDDQELSWFVRSRAKAYELDADSCSRRVDAIRSVTNGYPLFVDDLIRHAMLAGLESAIGDWSQKKGDAAREYALRRQLTALGEASRRALIAISVVNRPLSTLELANVSGFTDDDTQQAIQDLLSWRLVSRYGMNEDSRPTFSSNPNTRRLVQKTYGADPIYDSYRASFANLAGSAPSLAARRAVGAAISNAMALALRGDLEGAEQHLHSSMTGELKNNPDLWGALGYIRSRKRTGTAIADAREAFRRAHELGSRKEDTYFHWARMEREIAESLVGRSCDEDVLNQWRAAGVVTELGIERCGETPSLCQMAAYLKTREAKTLEHLNQFTPAQNCYSQGAEWARRSLDAPNPSSREVSQSQLYRTLVLALEGAGETERAAEALKEWETVSGSDDPELQRELERFTLRAR